MGLGKDPQTGKVSRSVMRSLKRPIPVKVKTHAAYKSREVPTSFSIGSRPIKVNQILDCWYGKNHAYFKVMAGDEDIYILRFDENEEAWELVFMDADPHFTPK